MLVRSFKDHLCSIHILFFPIRIRAPELNVIIWMTKWQTIRLSICKNLGYKSFETQVFFHFFFRNWMFRSANIYFEIIVINDSHTNFNIFNVSVDRCPHAPPSARHRTNIASRKWAFDYSLWTAVLCLNAINHPENPFSLCVSCPF